MKTLPWTWPLLAYLSPSAARWGHDSVWPGDWGLKIQMDIDSKTVAKSYYKKDCVCVSVTLLFANVSGNAEPNWNVGHLGV
jgi:hypothetical protein